MRNESFMLKMMSRTLLIAFVFFMCASTSIAQNSIAEKIASVKSLFSNSFSSLDDVQRSKIISFFESCSKPQKEAVLSYMIQTITDSLKADKKEFAINYIDYYRLIAEPDNEYLGSLVVTEGKYYYEKMDASKLASLHLYLSDIASKSNLDYSSEVSELYRMRDEVLNGCQELLGYWVADFSDKNKADPFFVYIHRDYKGEYHVTMEYSSTVSSYYTDMWQYGNELGTNYHFCFTEKQESDECTKTSPTSLSFFWSSEKLNVGKEGLATALRSGARGISSSIVGEFARSNKYDFGTSLLGSTGAILGEAILNAIIDGVSISKKTIRTITGTFTPIDRNNIKATLYLDYFKLRSDNPGIDEEHLTIDVNLVRCQWQVSSMSNTIAFVDGQKYLRQSSPLSKKERKQFYKLNPKARSIVRKIKLWPYSFVNNRKLRNYNRLQLEKVKEYNKTH